MSDKICLIKHSNIHYPDKKNLFRPSCKYSEYLFGDFISDEYNGVYDMVREAMFMYGLDERNYGTKRWNPLRGIIQKNDNVLIKPNMVLHTNFLEGEGTDCLYTHPSVVATIIDYVAIALDGSGSITVADAPLQECKFDVLVKESGYADLIEFYRNKGLNIRLVDLRNMCTEIRDGVHFPQKGSVEKRKGIKVDLSNESAFFGIGEDRMRRLRVTNFDPRILQKHHSENKHEYLIADEVLEADVIINVPKPKTHRKAGITASLKNLVGITASKEYLPHHTNGSVLEGGDAYLNHNDVLNYANELLDQKNIAVADKDYDKARELVYEHYRLLDTVKDERYWEGSWYGNDTIWRTISDLNKILYYADKSGHLKDSHQRRVLIFGDMIVSGQKEGPLFPTSKYAGVIAIGENPVVFDRTICSIMGFDYSKVPSLMADNLKAGKYRLFSEDNKSVIISNNEKWDGCDYNKISYDNTLGFIPSKGWEAILGNKEKDRVVSGVEQIGKPVVIFGAGYMGIDCALYLQEKLPHIELIGFMDNNEHLWGKSIIHNKECFKPQKTDEEMVCIIGAKMSSIEAIRDQIKNYGFIDVFDWNFD